MIISEQWLRDWVSTDLDAQQIADCLTNAGLEVDGVETVSEPIDNLLVGVVKSVEKHPDADRLNLTQVDTGSETLSIVCGAPNVREGMYVAVATVGAKLPNGMKIKKAKVRGVESFGMLCSAAELGLAEESSGLIDLGNDAPIGERVDEYLKLADSVIDIDLTPNRGDCLSVMGIARELKVLADADYHPVEIAKINAASDASIDVDVEQIKECPVYCARVIEGVDQAAATPLWMTERLRRSGLRPISALVDITNYVMLELGQPMHAFDRNKIEDKIKVRFANEGEPLTLLDDSEIKLNSECLVIADANKPLALAGVMGGADSAIGDQTKDIVLEAAHFTRKVMAGRARQFGLHTDSSHRFERGVDPELPIKAIERATELVLEICGGQAGQTVDVGSDNIVSKAPVTIRFDRLKTMLGMQIENDTIVSVLSRIADNAQSSEQECIVNPPSYRFDIERECDLVEEVARVYGYANIPTVMPTIKPSSVVASESAVGLRKAKDRMASLGYQEVINYSFIDPAMHDLVSDVEPVKLANPLADNMSVMRTNLLAGLLQTMQYNLNRQNDRIRIFETGAVYLNAGNKGESGFSEKQYLAGLVQGNKYANQWGYSSSKSVDFFDLKSDVESVLALTDLEEPIIFNTLQHKALHPGQQAAICRGDQTIGWLGKIHPSIAQSKGFKSDVFVFELALEGLLESKVPAFEPVSKFPSVTRDISVVVDSKVPFAELEQVLTAELSDCLSSIVLFDIYEGESVGDNNKSLSYSLSFRRDDRTYTDDEVEVFIEKALTALNSKVGATLRS